MTYDYAEKLNEIEEALDESDFEQALQLISELQSAVETMQEKGKN